MSEGEEKSDVQKMAEELRAEFAKTTETMRTELEAFKEQSAKDKETITGLQRALIEKSMADDSKKDPDKGPEKTEEEIAAEAYQKKVNELSELTLKKMKDMV